MVRVAWRMLRERPAGALAALVALWFGVAVVTACGVMLESGLRYDGTPQRYAGSTLLIASTDLTLVTGAGEDRSVDNYPLPERGRVDTGIAARVAAVPGVRRVVADSAVPTEVLEVAGGSGAVASGHPWSAAALTPFALRQGGPPAADQVVLDADLARDAGVRIGQRVRLGLPDGVETFTVSGVAAPRGAGPPEPTVFFADAQAAALAGHAGTADVLGVIADPGVDSQVLASAVRGVLPAPASPTGALPRVYADADRGLVESPAVGEGRDMVIALASVFGGNTLMIAAIAVAGAVGLSVQQRQRDVALLRAIAATPRQVRRMVVVEAALLALLAGVAGVWPGLAAIGWLRDQFVARAIVPDSFRVHVSWLPAVVAVGAGMLVAVGSAWVASLRPSRIRPAAAMTEATLERRGVGVPRALLGLAALAGGVALAAVAGQVRGSGAAGVAVGVVFTLVIAVALLGPWVVRAGVAVGGVALRRMGVTGTLATANAAAAARRLSTVLSAAVLAVALGGSLWFLQTSVQHVAAQQGRSGMLADHVVSAGAGMSPATVERIRRVPGVAAVTGVVHSRILSEQDDAADYAAQGVDTQGLGLGRTVDLDVVTGTLSDLRAGTVAVDTITADDLGLRVGDEFRGWFGDGVPTRLRVVAVYRRGLGFAPVTLPSAVLLAHTAGRYDQVFVADSPGADRATVGAAISAALGRVTAGAAVADRGAYQASLDRNLAQQGWVNQVVVAVLLVYVLIAAVNTLITAALARRRELAVLRLAGATRTQILRMARLEQAVLLTVALLVGGGIAAVTLLPMVRGATGQPTPYIPTAGWMAVVGGTLLVGMLATLTPIRRALRTPPIEAIGLRE